MLIKYGEIALRKGNRARFEKILAKRIEEACIGVKVSREQGRLTARGEDLERQIPIISRVFGVTAIAPTLAIKERNIKNICESAINYLRDLKSFNNFRNFKTFKVEARRSDKAFALKSPEICQIVGEAVINNLNLSVDVHNPELTLWVEVRDLIYIYADAYLGEGGLPYATGGRGVVLLSGGIDSVVAAYLMAKRGIEIFPLYCHTPPFASEDALKKALDATERLSLYAPGVFLKSANITEITLYIKKNLPPDLMTIYMKRAMLRLACSYAKKINALCVITGDSVGQVASQTLHGILSMDAAASYPILRPLAAMEKQIIINISKKIGAYEICIRPEQDCCSIFAPKNPQTKPNVRVVNSIEAKHTELLKLTKEVENVFN